MKRFFISVDLDVAGVEADNEEEALKIAKQYIKDGSYSLSIADSEEIKDEEN